MSTYQIKYLKYKAKYLALQNMLGGAPSYIFNQYHKTNPDKPTLAGIDDNQALKNGEYLVTKLHEYLSCDNHNDFKQKYNYFDELYPTTKLSSDDTKKYKDFFENKDNKIWLGRQAYLFTTQKDITTIFGDDLLSFFNWLTNRLSDDALKYFPLNSKFQI
jgi:hypothetical protein